MGRRRAGRGDARGEPERAGASRLAGLRAAGVTRISLGVQSLRDAGARGARPRAQRGGGARRLRGGAGGGVREREHRPHLRHPGPVGGGLGRWADGGDRAPAGPPEPLCAAAGAGAGRVGGAATRRRPALAATPRGAPGRRARRRAVRARRVDAGGRGIPALRAQLVGATGPRGTPQRGLLGARAVHRHRRRRAFLRRARGGPGTRATSTPTWNAQRRGSGRSPAARSSTSRRARSRPSRSGCGASTACRARHSRPSSGRSRSTGSGRGRRRHVARPAGRRRDAMRLSGQGRLLANEVLVGFAPASAGAR